MMIMINIGMTSYAVMIVLVTIGLGFAKIVN